MAKVIWSDDALEDLGQIVSYIANDNPDAALRTGMKIIEHVELLTNFPRMGPVYIADESIRLTVTTPYCVYYSYNESKDSIVIEHVWHGARQQPNFE